MLIDNRPLVSLHTVVEEFLEYQIILDEIKENFKLDYLGDHGIFHWYFVYKNTQLLSQHYQIDSKVFKLFSLLHDSKRENEFEDKEHGKKASKYILELVQRKLIDIQDSDLARLLFACENHTYLSSNNELANDIIVQICLDSDKLDLPRVGITPKEKYMLTSYAKGYIKTNAKQ